MLLDETVAVPQFKPCELVLAPLEKLQGAFDSRFVGRAAYDFNGSDDFILEEIAAHRFHSDLTDCLTSESGYGRWQGIAAFS